jgi:hypothetical protein
MLMAEIAKGVENRSGKQPISIFEGNHLTAMEMPGQNQVKATLTGGFPDARIVRTENSNIAIGYRCRVGAGHANDSRTMCYSSGIRMNPFTTAAHYRIANSMQADMAVMVAANSEDRSYHAKRADQIAKLA